MTRSRINFQLTNKTNHSIKIIWDEAAFIGSDSQTSRIAHHGVKYSDSNAPQPPSVVPAKGRLSDFAVPTDRFYYRKGYYSRYSSEPGGWEELGLIYPDEKYLPVVASFIVDQFRSEAEQNKGQRIGLLLPMEIEGVVNEYTFWFEVQSVSVTTSSN